MTIYTTGWTREKLKSSEQYQAWLASLKDRDTVALQQFLPASDSCLSMPFERWLFTKGTVGGIDVGEAWLRFNERGHTQPVRRDGIACFWNRDREWGEVFPARIIPLHSDLGLHDGQSGKFVSGHAPVYEPEFFHNYRHVFFVGHGKDFYARQQSLRNRFPRNYSLDVDDGVIVHVFSRDDFEDEIPGVRYCYSKYQGM